MNAVTVAKARRAAVRFIEAVNDVEQAMKDNPTLFYGSRETATLRRASMDLTRALADLRKSG
jgi:hypothetical protein